MSFLQRACDALGLDGHIVYLRSLEVSQAGLVPRSELFSDLGKLMPHDAEAFLEFGIGTGELMNEIVQRRQLLAKNGIYIGVDCNPESMKHIRRRKPDIASHPQVHLIQDYAQNAGEQIRDLLQKRRVNVTISSIPFSEMSQEDVWKSMQIVTSVSHDDSNLVHYSVRPSIHLLQPHWKHIHTVPTRRVHYGIPPEFDVHFASGPIVEPSQETAHINGVSQTEMISRLQQFLLGDIRMRVLKAPKPTAHQ